MEFQHQARKIPSLLRKPFFSLIGCYLITVILSNIAQSATLTKWEFDPSNNQLTLSLEAQTTPNIFILTDPPRLVIDLPDTEITDIPRQQNYPGKIKEIRASQFDAETTRLVLEFSPETRFSAEPFQISPREGYGWLIRPRFETSATAAATNFPLPPANASPPQENVTVQVPPLPGNNNNSTPSLPQTTRTPMIKFGQPLPPQGNISGEVPPNSFEGILTAGKTLSLRYPGETHLILRPTESIQEVLLVAEALLNSSQKVIIPEGTPIIGRFETDTQGSRFVTQAIIINGTNIPLQAISPVLSNLRPVVNRNNISTREMSIEPNFLLQVQLREDWQYQ